MKLLTILKYLQFMNEANKIIQEHLDEKNEQENLVKSASRNYIEGIEDFLRVSKSKPNGMKLKSL